jgi:hypothetical protein
MLTFHNPSAPEREDEMHNWYNWVHIRDVLSMDGTVTAVQRLQLASCQPQGADLRRKFVTVYEVENKEHCTEMHSAWVGSTKLEISTAFGTDFGEGYWDIDDQTADFATYADYAGDKAVFFARLDGGAKAPAKLTPAVLAELAALPGFKSAHLCHWSTHQAPNSSAKSESVSHMLVAQVDDVYLAVQSWDGFAERKGLAEIDAAPCVYKPLFPRFTAAESVATPERQAITFLMHCMCGLTPKMQVYPTRG